MSESSKSGYEYVYVMVDSDKKPVKGGVIKTVKPLESGFDGKGKVEVKEGDGTSVDAIFKGMINYNKSIENCDSGDEKIVEPDMYCVFLNNDDGTVAALGYGKTEEGSRFVDMYVADSIDTDINGKDPIRLCYGGEVVPGPASDLAPAPVIAPALDKTKQDNRDALQVRTDSNNNKCWLNAALYAVVIPDSIFEGNMNPDDSTIENKIYNTLKQYKNDRTQDQWNVIKWKELIQNFKVLKTQTGTVKNPVLNDDDFIYSLDVDDKNESDSAFHVAGYLIEKIINVMEKKETILFVRSNRNHDSFNTFETDVNRIIKKGYTLTSIIQTINTYECENVENHDAGHYISYTLNNTGKYTKFDASSFGTTFDNEYTLKDIVSTEITLTKINELYKSSIINEKAIEQANNMINNGDYKNLEPDVENDLFDELQTEKEKEMHSEKLDSLLLKQESKIFKSLIEFIIDLYNLKDANNKSLEEVLEMANDSKNLNTQCHLYMFIFTKTNDSSPAPAPAKEGDEVNPFPLEILPVTGDTIDNGKNKCWLNAPLYAFLAHEQTWNIYKHFYKIDDNSKIKLEHSFLTYLRENSRNWNKETYNAVQYYLYKLNNNITQIVQDEDFGDTKKVDFNTIKTNVKKKVDKLISDKYQKHKVHGYGPDGGFDDTISGTLKNIFTNVGQNPSLDTEKYIKIVDQLEPNDTKRSIKNVLEEHEQGNMYCVAIVTVTVCNTLTNSQNINHFNAYVRTNKNLWKKFDALDGFKGIHGGEKTTDEVENELKCIVAGTFRRREYIFVNFKPEDVFEEEGDVRLIAKSDLLNEIGQTPSVYNISTQDVHNEYNFVTIKKTDSVEDVKQKIVNRIRQKEILVDYVLNQQLNNSEEYIKRTQHIPLENYKLEDDQEQEEKKKLLEVLKFVKEVKDKEAVKQREQKNRGEDPVIIPDAYINSVVQDIIKSSNYLDEINNANANIDAIFFPKAGGSRRNRRNDRKQKQNRKQNQRTRKRKTSLT